MSLQEDSPECFEVFLSSNQYSILKGVLPKGYSLRPSSDCARTQASQSATKKFIAEDVRGAPQASKISVSAFSHSYNSSAAAQMKSDSDKKRSGRDKSQKKKQISSFEIFEKRGKNYSQTMMRCLKLLQQLKRHNYAHPFLKPVDTVSLGLHDYHVHVKEPMDLGTVEKKLMVGDYSTSQQFAADVRKIWRNALSYNHEGTDIYYMTEEMEKYFDRIYLEMEKNIGGAKERKATPSIEKSESSSNISELQRKVKTLSKNFEDLKSKGNAVAAAVSNNISKNTLSTASPKKKAKSGKKGETLSFDIEEKRDLGNQIRKLQQEDLRGVWNIVITGTDYANNNNSHELEFDIDTLPPKKLKELQKYVKKCLNKKKAKKEGKASKKEPRDPKPNKSDNEQPQKKKPVKPAKYSLNETHNENEENDSVFEGLNQGKSQVVYDQKDDDDKKAVFSHSNVSRKINFDGGDSPLSSNSSLLTDSDDF